MKTGSLKFQSTLPRRERRDQPNGCKLCDRVSIHAPAKGATRGGSPDLPSGGVSIHAPAKGATGADSSIRLLKCSFNPRSREGSDNEAGYRFVAPYVVSIHAPAKGATVRRRCGSLSPTFQSTLPRRERPMQTGIRTRIK